MAIRIASVFIFISIFIFIEKTAAQSDRLLHSSEVYFAFGKHALRPAADSVLRAAAQIFTDLSRTDEGREGEKRHIKITAHTDSIGSLKNNIALSERRAAAVMDFLSENGVPDSLMSSLVFGETQPAAANRTDEGRQRNRRATVEIWEAVPPVPMTTLEGQIKVPDPEQFLLAEVIIRGKSFRDSLMTDSTGFFKTEVPTGAIIGVDVIAKGYFLESKMMKVQPGQMPLMEILMRPATVGEVADIENLYFVGNQDILLNKSEPTLPKILRFMQVNQCLTIEIAGHVNHPNTPPLAENTWEFDLSERRAKRVYNFLIENGIPAERLSWKGYANWEMRYPQARSEEHQAANRRVEIRVTGVTNDE